MHEEDDVVLNSKAVLLAVGGAALAGLLFVLARRDDKPEEPAERVEAVIEDVKKDARKKAKAARKKREELVETASENAQHLADDVRETAERDLKAAAWDAQQRAHEAESRLRAAGHRVVDDASHIASRVGSEARSLAEEGRERIAHLRHRDDEPVAEREIERLRAEIESLREQLGESGRKAERDVSNLAARFTGKSGTVPEAMVSEAAAVALSQLERTLKAKAPALMAAKNRGQVLEILQQDLGPTLRETIVQAASAALNRFEAARDESGAAEQVEEATRKAGGAAKRAVDDAAEFVDGAAANGKHRFWRHQQKVAESAADVVEEAGKDVAADEPAEEEHRGKAGLFWGGAGLGLAIYALLDTERREQVLRFANDASIQVQELVRDLQGYDDEF